MIKLGSKGNFVRLWQEYLNAHGFPCGRPDGVFGKKTAEASRAFQAKYGVAVDGVVGAGTFRFAAANGWPAPEGYPLMQAANYRRADRKKGDVKWIVIHTMEVPEKSYLAEEIMRRFCDGSSKFSAHYGIDDDSVVQGVLTKDIAFCAAGANKEGIHLEHAGYSGQFPDDWKDDFSVSQLKLSAKLAAELCKKFDIPPVWREGPELANGERGITGHKQVNDAFNGGQGHHDPGKSFPREEYVEMVRWGVEAA